MIVDAFFVFRHIAVGGGLIEEIKPAIKPAIKPRIKPDSYGRYNFGDLIKWCSFFISNN